MGETSVPISGYCEWILQAAFSAGSTRLAHIGLHQQPASPAFRTKEIASMNVRSILLAAATTVVMGTAAVPAFAADIDDVRVRQQERIREGFRSGQLTRHELVNLEQEQSRIDGLIRRARADGQIDPMSAARSRTRRRSPAVTSLPRSMTWRRAVITVGAGGTALPGECFARRSAVRGTARGRRFQRSGGLVPFE